MASDTRTASSVTDLLPTQKKQTRKFLITTVIVVFTVQRFTNLPEFQIRKLFFQIREKLTLFISGVIIDQRGKLKQQRICFGVRPYVNFIDFRQNPLVIGQPFLHHFVFGINKKQFFFRCKMAL